MVIKKYQEMMYRKRVKLKKLIFGVKIISKGFEVHVRRIKK